MPPIPKELIAALRFCLVFDLTSHSLKVELTNNGVEKRASGFGVLKLREGGICLFSMASIVFNKPAMPQATSKCPMYLEHQ